MEKKLKFEWKKKRGKHQCMMCGNCVACCPNFPNRPIRFNKSSKDLAFDDEIVHDPKKCSWCRMCEKVCPEGMIKIKQEVKNGRRNM